MPEKEPIAARFWRHVLIAEGADACWIWLGTRTRDGYGRVRTIDRVQDSTHRVSWILANGPVPDGLCVLHRCDHKPCVRPSHLFLGTKADNTHDMIEKGRAKFGKPRVMRGEEHPNAELDQERVRWIRRVTPARLSQADAAWLLGIGQGQVWRIARGKSWAHLPLEA